MPSLYKKKTGTRDPSKLIIAVEGHKREKQYFDWFSDQKSRVRIVILEPKVVFDEAGNKVDDVGRVKPMQILSRLQSFIKNGDNDVQKFDHIWIVMDADKFKHEHEIRDLAKEMAESDLIAEKENRHLALSMPCFEIWLLLHLADIQEGQAWKNCMELKEHLPTVKSGGFDSTKDITPQRVKDAVARAHKLNALSTSFIPSNPGTKVHELATILLDIIG